MHQNLYGYKNKKYVGDNGVLYKISSSNKGANCLPISEGGWGQGRERSREEINKGQVKKRERKRPKRETRKIR